MLYHGASPWAQAALASADGGDTWAADHTPPTNSRHRRLALIDLRRTYNESWLIERHGHRSPTQFRRDQMDKLPLAA